MMLLLNKQRYVQKENKKTFALFFHCFVAPFNCYQFQECTFLSTSVYHYYIYTLSWMGGS